MWRMDSDCILMQYTGLKDWEGKEIYEGDIFKWGCQIGSVYQNNNSWVFAKTANPEYPSMALTISRTKEGKIIGNIYENPELLNENGDK